MRTTKVVSISLPAETLAAAQKMAAKEQRTMSELMREAFRVYQREHEGMGRACSPYGERAERRRASAMNRTLCASFEKSGGRRTREAAKAAALREDDDSCRRGHECLRLGTHLRWGATSRRVARDRRERTSSASPRRSWSNSGGC